MDQQQTTLSFLSPPSLPSSVLLPPSSLLLVLPEFGSICLVQYIASAGQRDIQHSTAAQLPLSSSSLLATSILCDKYPYTHRYTQLYIIPSICLLRQHPVGTQIRIFEEVTILSCSFEKVYVHAPKIEKTTWV